MKKVNLMILAIAALMFASCGSNTNSNVTAEFWETDNSL